MEVEMKDQVVGKIGELESTASAGVPFEVSEEGSSDSKEKVDLGAAGDAISPLLNVEVVEQFRLLWKENGGATGKKDVKVKTKTSGDLDDQVGIREQEDQVLMDIWKSLKQPELKIEELRALKDQFVSGETSSNLIPTTATTVAEVPEVVSVAVDEEESESESVYESDPAFRLCRCSAPVCNADTDMDDVNRCINLSEDDTWKATYSAPPVPSQGSTDVTILVEGEKFPAHRHFLSSQSEFFKSLLKENAKSEVKLEKITVPVFKAILKYFYEGRLNLSELEKAGMLLDVIRLSQDWDIRGLRISIYRYFRHNPREDGHMNSNNFWTILAFASNVNNCMLKLICFLYFDRHAYILLQHASFLRASWNEVLTLINRPGFPATHEVTVAALTKWLKKNKDTFPEVSKVLLHRINYLYHGVPYIKTMKGRDTFLEMVYTVASHLSPKCIEDACGMMRAMENDIDCPPHLLTLEVGLSKEMIRSGVCTNFNPSRGLAHHIIEDGNPGIIINVGAFIWINNIQMQLLDTSHRTYSYYVEISCDKENWSRVCDHSKHHCRSFQNIYTYNRLVRFIKIVGTGAFDHKTKTAYPELEITSLKIQYVWKNVAFHMKTGITIMEENVKQEMPKKKDLLAKIPLRSGKPRAKGLAIEINGIKNVNYFPWFKIGEIDGEIKIQLNQPYDVTSLHVRLNNEASCTFDWRLEVSVDNQKWKKVCGGEKEESKKIHGGKFRSRSVVYIRYISSVLPILTEK